MGIDERDQPEQLQRGKLFQAIVQEDFRTNNQSGLAEIEKCISLLSKKTGRMDIAVTNLGDMVAIYELKATDWDEIKPANVNRNLYRHQRQLFTYVDKYVEVENLSVCHGIIYPWPPKAESLREHIESRLTEFYGVPAYWYTEVGHAEFVDKLKKAFLKSGY